MKGEEGLRSMIGIGFCMLHFPFRSIERFRLKIEDGIKTLNATPYPSSIGKHWRFYYQQYKIYGDDALKKYFFDHIRRCL